MRMVVRIHNNAAVSRTDTQPTAAASFTDADVFSINVTNLTDGCTAVDMYFTDFARRKTEQSVVALFSHQLCAGTSTTSHLAAFTNFHFHVVYGSTKRNVFQRQAVTGFDICVRTAYYDIANFQIKRSDDVTFFAVNIVDQSDTSVTVRIVFNGSNLSRNAVFGTLEINDTILFFMTAALMTNSHFTGIITACMFTKFFNKRAVRLVSRNLFEGRHSNKASGRRIRIKAFNSHLI